MAQPLHEVHPLLTACAEIEDALASVADVQPAYASTSDRAEVLRACARIEARQAELRLRVMAASADVAEGTGARDVAEWYAHATRTPAEVARADLALAQRLDRDQDVLAAALRAGEVNVAQARAISHVVDQLPGLLKDTTEGPETVRAAEAHLVAQASRFGPRELRRLGRRILHVVAPAVAEAAEAAALERQERSAQEKTRLTMRRCGDGTTRISAVVPDASGTRLATYLDAFANPRRTPADTDTETSPIGDPVAKIAYPKRMGEAFTRFLEAVDPTRLPLHGGDATTVATTVVITIDLAALKRDLASATLPAGSHVPGDAHESAPDEQRITAGEARRLACTAKLLPMVLGGESLPLDVGRTQRLFTPAQRKALLVRDKTCRAEGCTVPGTWCDAHHLLSWAEHRGRTDLTNGVLLCGHHHRRAHDTTYRHDRLPDGTLRFTRRT